MLPRAQGSGISRRIVTDTVHLEVSVVSLKHPYSDLLIYCITCVLHVDTVVRHVLHNKKTMTYCCAVH